MMSGSVFLNNLDDFIAPSQACINPLVSSKLPSAATKVNSGAGISKGHAKVVLVNDSSASDFDASIRLPVTSRRPDLIQTKVSDAKRVATVSLNDCLACRCNRRVSSTRFVCYQ